MHESWDLKDRKCMLLLLVVFMGGGVKSETQSEKAISEQPFFTAEYSIWFFLIWTNAKDIKPYPKNSWSAQMCHQSYFHKKSAQV